MRHGQSARRRRVMAVVLVVAGLVNPIFSAPSTDVPDGAVMTVKVGDGAFDLVRIPAGTFVMGSQTGDRDETPVHEVRIGANFYLGRTEVTVRQFRAFVEATGYKTDAEQAGWANACPLPGGHPHQRGLDWRRPGFETTDDHPAVVISRKDAMAFCQWLSEQTGRSFRLPTEAEWEYAARAGGPREGGTPATQTAWYEENASDCAHAVGAKAANAWGLCDMQGNAWEWCLDVWRPDYREAAPDGRAEAYDPVVPQVAWRYVLRGGSWASPTRQLSLSYRARYMNNLARPDTGFRVALAPAAVGETTLAISARAVTSGRGSCAYDSQKRRTILEVQGARFEFARIPAGEFLMGGEGGIEKPAHQVRIGYDFEMGTTEVTIRQFRAFLQATGYATDSEKGGINWTTGSDLDWQREEAVDWREATRGQSDDHPAVFVSWYDAMAFCHWLSGQTGQEIRLPSEAEWEHACRAGSTGLYAGELNEMGWYLYNACNRTHPVAQKQPNAWGLYDMHGNVWEWCLDFFQPNYEGVPTDGRPRWEVERAMDVVSRGGSFRNPPGWLASGCRMGSYLDCSHGNNGFRLAHVLKEGTNERPAAQVTETSAPGRTPAGAAGLVPVEVKLPSPIFVGTQEDLRAPRIKPVQTVAGPPFLAPVGTRNVALGKPVSSSDPEPIIGELTMITDGDKEGADGSYVELAPLLQHVTIDLQSEYEIYGIRAWHYHKQPRVYFDVIVQIANDQDFIAGVKTIFNNDMDNSAGLGVGADLHYVDTHFGELFDAGGACGRYVRLYSRGNTNNDQNHYIEVEVYGRPVAP
jgi:formylglycine-generating enzyme required for sulfatase activity